MTRKIFDIIPPQQRKPIQRFWSRNAGRIKIGLLLVFLITAAFFITASYTNLFRSQGPSVPEVEAATGGPDNYGYIWKDTAEAGVTYSWDDISTTGTLIPGTRSDESISTAIALGFTFQFYGGNQTTVYVSNNGCIAFNATFCSWDNTNLPNSGTPNNIIAPWWTNFWTGGSILYQVKGTAPNRYLVVSWLNVDHFNASGANGVTFEAILSETTNLIKFQYQDVSFGSAEADSGATGTVGIEGVNGTNGLTRSYDSAALSNLYAIQFTLSSPQKGDGRVIAGSTTNATPQEFRWYSGELSGAQGIQAAAADIQQVKVGSSPTADESIEVSQASAVGIPIHVQRRSAFTWTSEWTVDTSNAVATQRGFDVDYENLSGRAIVAYTTNVASPKYRIWRPSLGTWTGELTITVARTTGAVRWIQLVPRAGTDEMALIYSDANSNLNVLVSTGCTDTACTWAQEPGTLLEGALGFAVAAADVKAFDADYLGDGRLLIVWSLNLTPFAKSSIKTAGSGTYSACNFSTGGCAGATGYAAATSNVSVRAEPSGGSNRAVFAAQDTAGNDLEVAAFDGTSWSVVTSDIDGAIGAEGAAFQLVETFWAVSGSVRQGIVFYVDAAGTGIDWYNWNASGGATTFAAGTDIVVSPALGAGTERSHHARIRPDTTDELMMTTVDSTTSMYLTKLVWTGAAGCTASCWTVNNTAGASLASPANQAISSPLDFAYDRYIPAVTFTQSSYRVFNNTDSRDLNGVHNNPSSLDDRIQNMAIDTAGGFMYLVGKDNVASSEEWRIEKRNLSDGSLVTAFGTNGVITYNPTGDIDSLGSIAIDTTSSPQVMYLVGRTTFFNPGANWGWTFQKRRLDNGNLCDAANCGTAFGTAGTLNYNYTTGNDSPTSNFNDSKSIAIDTAGGVMYVAGQNALNGTQWEIEKRLLSTGALVTAFGGLGACPAGIVCEDLTANVDEAYVMAIDVAGGNMYVGGYSGYTGASANPAWRIEQRSLSTGVLGWGVTEDLSTQYDIVTDIKIDPAAQVIYVAGVDHATSDGSREMRIEKRNMSNGTLVTSFGSPNGYVTSNPTTSYDSALALEINTTEGVLYVGGSEKPGFVEDDWRVEKRSLSTGAPVTAFGSGGVVRSSPGKGDGDSSDLPFDAALDEAGGVLYLGGFDGLDDNGAWRVEKINTSDGSWLWGTPLAALNAAATLNNAGQAFRLRMLLHIGGNALLTNSQSFKLQFAQQSGTCDTAFSGETYADVTAASLIAYKDNLSAVDGATGVPNSNDPTHGTDSVYIQTYEELNNFANSVRAVNSGQDTEWDFALFDNGAPASTSYCFRAVKSDSTILNTYSVIPEVKTFGTTFNQSAYRLFANLDSTNVGAALAAQNTAATLTSAGQAFRARMLIHVGSANLAISGQAFTLQFASRSGTCDTGFAGETYADVTTATPIAYNNNPAAGATDGATLTDNIGELTHGADAIVVETYEELNTFTNSVAAVNIGQDGKWDFALFDNGAPVNAPYCFRAVKSDGSLLDTYAAIPEITTATPNATPGVPSSLAPLLFTAGGYSGVNNPSLTFSLSDTDAGQEVRYCMEIDDSADFSSVIVRHLSPLAAQGSFSYQVGAQASSAGTGCTPAVGALSQTLPDSVPSTSTNVYYWRVKTRDAGGAESAWSTANLNGVTQFISFFVDTTATRTTRQIAIPILFGTTLQAFDGTTNGTGTSGTSQCFAIPMTNTSPKVRSALLELTGLAVNSTANPTGSLALELRRDVDPQDASCTSTVVGSTTTANWFNPQFSINIGTGVTPFLLRYNAFREGLCLDCQTVNNLVSGTYYYKLYVENVTTGQALYGVTAKLMLVYDY